MYIVKNESTLWITMWVCHSFKYSIPYYTLFLISQHYEYTYVYIQIYDTIELGAFTTAVHIFYLFNGLTEEYYVNKVNQAIDIYNNKLSE